MAVAAAEPLPPGGVGGSKWSLPPAVAQEVLRRYGDILRVGRVSLNGQEVSWDTNSSNEGQLESFCRVLSPTLAAVAPELAEKDPDALRFAPYWLCKAVSINYALIEIVLMVQQRVGVLCSIETREDFGSGLVEYNIEMRPGNMLYVSMNWRKADNIIYCDPLTAKREVKGTLSYLETCFPVPPVEGFTPAYSFQLRLRRSLTKILTSSLTSRFACGAPERRASEGRETVSVCIEEPLRSEAPLESCAELVEKVSGGVAAAVAAAAAAEETIPAPVEGCAPFSEPSTASSASRWAPKLEWDSEANAGNETAEAALVGFLHVRLVHCRGFDLPSHVWPDGSITDALDPATKVYATLAVGGQTKQTKQVQYSERPEWLESIHFPLKAQDLRHEVVVRIFLYNPRKGLRFWGRGAVPVSATLGVMTPCISNASMAPEPSSQGARLRRRLTVSEDAAIIAQLDGNGGSAVLELDLVPEAPTPAPAAPSSSARRHTPAAMAAAAVTALSALGHLHHHRGGTVPEEDAVSASGWSECPSGGSGEDEECIVEVGPPLGLAARLLSSSGLSDGFRGLDFIQVRGEKGSGSSNSGLWCSSRGGCS